MNMAQSTVPSTNGRTISPTEQCKSLSSAINQTHDKPGIRVLLADDHPVLRRGLACCLAIHSRIDVIGEASDGREAITKATTLVPEVILMDIDMPQINGLGATEILRRQNPNLKVIILSALRHPEYVHRVLQCGARGYVLKEASPEELIRAIEAVHAGQTFFGPDVSRIALNRFVNGTGDGGQLNQLSNREQEVLVALAEGLSNKEIAPRLGIAVRTVETHREAIMRKLNIRGVAGLTRFAIAKGLIALPKETEMLIPP